MGKQNQEMQGYLSFLLRLWQEERAGKLVWRASLESAQTRERYGFATLPDLVTFLNRRTESEAHNEPIEEVMQHFTDEEKNEF